MLNIMAFLFNWTVFNVLKIDDFVRFSGDDDNDDDETVNLPRKQIFQQ